VNSTGKVHRPEDDPQLSVADDNDWYEIGVPLYASTGEVVIETLSTPPLPDVK